MSSSKSYIHPLDAEGSPLPDAFTFPFRYTPHPLCLRAADIVQRHIETLGLTEGKMFGVLVCQDHRELCFLAAYSGQLAGSYSHPWFVPPVLDYLQSDSHFQHEQQRIVALTHEAEALTAAAERQTLAAHLAELTALRDAAVAAARQAYAEGKAYRDKRRANGTDDPQLTAQSQRQKADVRRAKLALAAEIGAAQDALGALDARIEALRDERRQRSEALQQWLFDNFSLLNARGQRLTVTQIWARAAVNLIPSGAGECCAPKLLQAAYLNNLRPLAMAEFWWGPSPRDVPRRHLEFYPACQRKCRPILGHMLQGLSVEPDPAAHYDHVTSPLRIVWQDDSLAVVEKPTGWLSAPGRADLPNVQDEARRLWPEARGSIVVHRLDQDTSGLMLLAKTPRALHLMQRQFERREVTKRYTALLDGHPSTFQPFHLSTFQPFNISTFQPFNVSTFQPFPLSTFQPFNVSTFQPFNVSTFQPFNVSTFQPFPLSLPLSPCWDDLPRQRVDHEHGAEAITVVESLTPEGAFTRAVLRPLTGRTHQLRLHAASPEGIGVPIRGDRLYGNVADRLYLHAAELTFRHPVTSAPMHFLSPPPF